jgi:hypothetical protein
MIGNFFAIGDSFTLPSHKKGAEAFTSAPVIDSFRTILIDQPP